MSRERLIGRVELAVATQAAEVNILRAKPELYLEKYRVPHYSNVAGDELGTYGP